MSRQISMLPVLCPRKIDPLVQATWTEGVALGLPRPLIGRLLKLCGQDHEALLGTIREATVKHAAGQLTGSVIGWVCAEYVARAPASAHDEIRKAAREWDRTHGKRN